MASTTTREITLDDRYLLEEGSVYLAGLQALVRLPLEQARRDRRAGLRTGTFICGYPGSPLGSYDLALQRVRPLLAQHAIHHVPAANEELAATAISGTQMLDHYPHSQYDGVVGIWYGKGPGVDRSENALKHGNFAGTSQHGAVIVLSGEDHEAKSSTMPYQDDYAFLSAGIPILYPASVAEFLELGLHAIALSRLSGCWVALKLVGALCDGGETVTVRRDHPTIVVPEVVIDGHPFRKFTDFTFFPGKNIRIEHHLYYERHQAARLYARANALDRIEVQTPHDRLGIITAGKSYADVRQALLDMGLDDDGLRRHGIRLLRVGLIYPLDGETVREFARDLDEVIVIEEKRGFLEAQVKEALFGLPYPRKLVGKVDEQGAPLFPIQAGMDADLITERLGPRLLPYTGALPGVLDRLTALQAVRSRQYAPHLLRTPNYCSGCPHNTSTRLLDGQIAWGSPGCHSFASIMEQPERQIVSMTQYGGEGLPWVGLAPFTDRPHIVQNVGDGSIFHSSYQNIRFCVAAGARMTFKLLYNGAIANTGAQTPVGVKSVPALTRLLAEEGVRRIALVTKRPRAYRGARLSAITDVYPLARYEEALRGLEGEPGVTVLIYDELCANERRRQQKRGKLPKPNRFVMINAEVCENCGDCGAVTNYMSLQKVETECGTKTQVHQSSCNQDYSCLKGDCPSFVTVETRPGSGLVRPHTPRLAADAVPKPAAKVSLDGPYRIYIPGVGGTGVITINALLCQAAAIDGHHVLSYDQTGAAQKWGPVLSSLVLGPDGAAVAANKVGAAQADLYLAFDLLGGVAPANLDRCDPARTVAVMNTTVLPSGEMIRNPHARVSEDALAASIDRCTRAERNVRVEARRLAESLFGDYLMANMVAPGAAYQAGLIPLSAASIEQAVRLNGVQVETNLQAFRYGRLVVHTPERVAALVEPPPRDYAAEVAHARARLSTRDVRAYDALLARCDGLDAETPASARCARGRTDRLPGRSVRHRVCRFRVAGGG
jgi:indolepyruvate ferredoxin oxidoreductase